MTEKEEWKTATCYECGEGYESKEDYDDLHLGPDGERYHDICCPCPECYPVDKTEEKELTATQKKQMREDAAAFVMGFEKKSEPGKGSMRKLNTAFAIAHEAGTLDKMIAEIYAYLLQL